MKNITNTIETENHCGLIVPKDAYSFGRTIEYNQNESSYNGIQDVLFNKGRYFETSIYNKEILKEVSELTQIPIQFNNMICASWTKLEDLVIAMNCLGVKVNIDINWI